MAQCRFTKPRKLSDERVKNRIKLIAIFKLAEWELSSDLGN